MVKGFWPKQSFYVQKQVVAPNHVSKTREHDLEREELYHQKMLKGGFTYNGEFDFYYSKQGALVEDTNGSIENFISVPRYSDLPARGYEFSYGPPSPIGVELKYKQAIYCTNWPKVIADLREEMDTDKKDIQM